MQIEKTKQTRRKKAAVKRSSRRSTPPFSPLLGMIGGDPLTREAIEKFRNHLVDVIVSEGGESVVVSFIQINNTIINNKEDLLQELNATNEFGSTILGLLLNILRTGNIKDNETKDQLKTIITNILDISGIQVDLKTQDGTSILDQTIVSNENTSGVQSFFDKIFRKSKGFEALNTITDYVKSREKTETITKQINSVTGLTYEQIKINDLTYSIDPVPLEATGGYLSRFFNVVRNVFTYYELDHTDKDNGVKTAIDSLQYYTNVLIIKEPKKGGFTYKYPFAASDRMKEFISYLVDSEDPSQELTNMLTYFVGGNAFAEEMPRHKELSEFMNPIKGQIVVQKNDSKTMAAIVWIKLVHYSQFKVQFLTSLKK